MVSFSSRAEGVAAVAGDIETFRTAVRAGLDVEQCSVITAANASDWHTQTWMLLANRLESGNDLYSAVFDFRKVADSFIFDDLAELMILARSHNWPGLEVLLLPRARFYRSWARDQLAAASRIRAAKSVGWLAAVAPWVLVVLLSSRPENLSIFFSPLGLAVLLLGAVFTAMALLISARLARPRVISKATSLQSHDLVLHLANRIENLAFLLDAGLPLRLAIEQALTQGGRTLISEVDHFCELISSGDSIQEAAWAARKSAPSERVGDLFTKLAISDQLGMVSSQEFYDLGQTLRERWLVEQAASAQAIETKLLLPQVALSLPLTVLFALFPSVGMLSTSFL